MIEAIFLESVIKRLKENKTLADKTFEQLSEAEILHQPSDACNSIAQIIQHLHGNMQSRWTHFLTEDGEKPWRDRDTEFEKSTQSKEELLSLWEEGWKTLLNTLSSLQPSDLQRTIHIRTQPHIAMDAINRQLSHYSYHVGQIVYLGKMLKSVDWKNLSIAKGASDAYNKEMGLSGN